MVGRTNVNELGPPESKVVPAPVGQPLFNSVLLSRTADCLLLSALWASPIPRVESMFGLEETLLKLIKQWVASQAHQSPNFLKNTVF